MEASDARARDARRDDDDEHDHADERIIHVNLPQIGDVRLAFATLFLQRQLNDMLPHNEALARLALDLRSSPSTIRGSNYGGWQSDKTVFEREEPGLFALRQHITAAVRDLTAIPYQRATGNLRVRARLDGWINVIAHGDYNTPHFHAGSTWSGVYYIRAGDAAAAPSASSRAGGNGSSGAIEFLDPRPACEMNAGSQAHAQRLLVHPRDGLLLVFPGYLGHFVHPYFGKGERISLAFNCTVSTTDETPDPTPT
jgi:uncharacterized protein (TIGR02466 family)